MKKINKLFSACLVAALCLQMLPLAACDKNEPKEISTYTVSTLSTVGGVLSADTEKVEQGQDVTFTITPNEGYILESLIVNGAKVTVSGNTYVFLGAVCNITVKANFVKPNVTVTFDADGVVVEDMQVVYGKTFGELPTPIKSGKRFLHWKDEKNNVIRSSSIVESSGAITLYAVWEDIAETEKETLMPFSITTAYYDMAATKYGVVFHTEGEPISPSILVAENGNGDFTNAKMVECDYEPWMNEYVINGVVEDLAYNTEYSIKLGDFSADTWSDVYTFKTREETVTEANFIYVCDSQETYLINNKGEGKVIGETYWGVTMTDAIARFPETDFIAHGGDIVNHGAESDCWREMFGCVEEYLFQYPLMVSPGNHEGDGWYSAGYQCVGKMFNVDVTSNTERGFFYSFDYGPLHFVSVLSNDIYNNYDGNYTTAQLNWLRSDLAKAKNNPETKWIVAMSHMGILYADTVAGQSNSNDMSAPMYEQLMPILDEYNVSLFLYAHDHDLTSSYPLLWNNKVEQKVYDSYLQREVNWYEKKPATTTTRKTTWDGVQVDEFVYANSTSKKGTVMHQTATVGDQYHTTYKLSEKTQNQAKFPLFRSMVSGGKGAIDDVASYSMYSYIEVTADKIVCRTYGVNVEAQAVSPSLANGVYVDGFMMSK